MAAPNVSAVNVDLQAQVDRAVAAMRQEEASKLSLEQVKLFGVHSFVHVIMCACDNSFSYL